MQQASSPHPAYGVLLKAGCRQIEPCQDMRLVRSVRERCRGALLSPLLIYYGFIASEAVEHFEISGLPRPRHAAIGLRLFPASCLRAGRTLVSLSSLLVFMHSRRDLGLLTKSTCVLVARVVLAPRPGRSLDGAPCRHLSLCAYMLVRLWGRNLGW